MEGSLSVNPVLRSGENFKPINQPSRASPERCTRLTRTCG